ncbi:MAG: EamA family transporter [Sphingomonadales bacterium]|nr:EamA family transporter [Sphingomonadales bacterium]MBD3774253.1 EamA family transporter [Paracoccaceae bacterium]
MSEPERHALLQPRIALPFLLVTLIWGSTWLVIKDQLGMAPASWSVTWRFAIAAVGMALLALVRGERLMLDRQGQIVAIALGLTQFCFNFNFVYRAEQHLTSGLVAVLFGILMVPNALLGRLVLKTPITRGFMAGSAIGLAGIALMLVHEARMAPPEGKVWLGIALTLLAILCASSANVLQATPVAGRQRLLPLLAWALLWGALADAAIAWLTAGPPVIPADLRYWAGVSYLGIVGSVLTFPLYFMLIRELGPGRAAYNGVAVPVVAMLLSTLFEAYQWSLLAAAGGALALLGMAVALRARNPVRKSG